MTLTSYTPGPWQYHWGNQQTILRVSTANWQTPIAHVYDGHGTQKEAGEANARLIAAAPELLESLKELVDAESESPMHRHAMAVLAKAEGRAA
jgi:hypothetical protein